MTFENLAKLTNATLLNEPFISSFEHIVFDPIKVKRGDLFIGNDPEDIKRAIARDAYAILSDKPLNILDEEIAWLQCHDIKEALTALLRYYLMGRNLHFILFDTISVQLMQTIIHKDDVVFLGQDPQQNFQKIYAASDDTIVISADENYLQDIYPGFEIPDVFIHHPVKATKNTLFQSSFTYREKYYGNIKLPALFIKKFEYILNFLESKSLSYDIGKCDYIPQFYPLFVNRNLQLRTFGTTPKTLIVVEESFQIQDSITYLQKNAPWAKHLLFAPESMHQAYKLSIHTLRYQNLSEIIKLKDFEFNFAIINAHLSDVTDLLQNLQVKEQLSLF